MHPEAHPLPMHVNPLSLFDVEVNWNFLAAISFNPNSPK
jgi:hypothetical protein